MRTRRRMPRAKIIPADKIARALVTLLPNKWGMSAFPESGRSINQKDTESKGS